MFGGGGLGKVSSTRSTSSIAGSTESQRMVIQYATKGYALFQSAEDSETSQRYGTSPLLDTHTRTHTHTFVRFHI